MNRRLLVITALGVAAATAGQATPWRVASAPEVSIGSLDGELPYQLERVYGAVRLDDGTIVIGNSGSSELRFFDARGRHLQTVSRRGAGPGEFGRMSSIRPRLLGSERLIAEDAESRRINVYDRHGKYLGLFKLEPQPAAAWASVIAADNTTLVGMSIRDSRLAGAPGQLLRSRFQYAVFDTSGAQRQSLFELEGRPRLVHAYQGITHYPYIPLTGEPVVAAGGGRIFLLRNDRPEIEVWSHAGQRLTTFTWPAQRISVRDVWQRYRDAELAPMTQERDRVLYGHYYGMDLPLPQFVPVASQLQIDPAGNLWIERYRFRWETARRFDVLDRNGRFLGTVTTPGRLEVFQIGTDFLLGRARDSLDVEQVQLWRLARGK